MIFKPCTAEAWGFSEILSETSPGDRQTVPYWLLDTGLAHPLLLVCSLAFLVAKTGVFGWDVLHGRAVC